MCFREGDFTERGFNLGVSARRRHAPATKYGEPSLQQNRFIRTIAYAEFLAVPTTVEGEQIIIAFNEQPLITKLVSCPRRFVIPMVY